MHLSVRFVAVLAVAAVLGGCGAPGDARPSPSGGSTARTDAAGTPPPVAPAVSPSESPTGPPASHAVPSAGPAVPVPVFTSSVQSIGPDLAARMGASWRRGCPVPLEDLRYVTVSHVDFSGVVRTGELVVHADVADAVVQVFADLFAAGYPVRLMRLVDDFGGDDTRSMEADNTSAFNCRAVTGGSTWSEHAYGRAIDLNPVENPYVLGSHVAPLEGAAFADRPDAPGVIHADDEVVQAFARAGWSWGGAWSRPIDYQHFSVSGR